MLFGMLWILSGCHVLLPLSSGADGRGPADLGVVADVTGVRDKSLDIEPPRDDAPPPTPESGAPDTRPPTDTGPAPDTGPALVWQPVSNGSTVEHLHGVWGISNEVYVAGAEAVWRVNSGAWTSVASSNGPGFWRVRIDPSSKLGFAVGGNGIIHRYNGTAVQWPDLFTFGGTLYGLWVQGTSAVAVGVDEIWLWDQVMEEWGPASALTGATTYTAVWGSSAQDVWIADYAGSLHHFNGTTLFKTTTGTSFIYGIHGTGPNDIHAVVTNGTVLHYDGSYWSQPLVVGTGAGLRDVWAHSATVAFAVGDSGTILRYDGASWSSMTSGTTEALYGVWGTGPTDVYAVGTNGTMLHLSPVLP